MGRYVAEGVRTDCKTLVGKFGKFCSLRFHIFTEIWREMKFSYIYYGRKSFEELVEFTEEVLRIAKEFWLSSETLNERTGGLYLLYGLYLKQPTEDMVKIRLSTEDCESVKKFQQEIKAGGHYDACYVLARLFIRDGFQFCATSYPHALEKCYRKYHESDRSLREVGQEPVYLKGVKSNDLFAKLDNAYTEYHKAKCNLEGPNARNPPKLLDYINPKAGYILHQSFQEIACSSSSFGPIPSLSSEITQMSSPHSSRDPCWMVKTSSQREEDSSDSDSGDEDTKKGEIREDSIADVAQESVGLTLGLSDDDDCDGVSDTDSGDEVKQINNDPVPSTSQILDMPVLM